VRVFHDFPRDKPAAPEYPVVTIGVFDGLHRGHQRILEAALEVAAGRPVAVVTFDPHPRAVVGPPKHHRLLSTVAERLELFSNWPLAAVAVLRFDREIAATNYRDFVRGALVEALGARALVLGYSVRLGHERQGTPERLVELGRELGYEVVLVPAVEVDGEVASSTRVRRLLDAGEVERAAAVLGRPYSVRGTVVRGEGRGRQLGIPTANLEVPEDKLVPANGVYAVWARTATDRFAGALNIGVLPTFLDAGRRSIEVHLLGFEGDLYGTRLEVELVRRLREERRFAGPEALVRQVRADLAAARAALGGAAESTA
jgi:riboflavin kinase/FMN adenylyltransferase